MALSFFKGQSKDDYNNRDVLFREEHTDHELY